MPFAWLQITITSLQTKIEKKNVLTIDRIMLKGLLAFF